MFTMVGRKCFSFPFLFPKFGSPFQKPKKSFPLTLPGLLCQQHGDVYEGSEGENIYRINQQPAGAIASLAVTNFERNLSGLSNLTAPAAAEVMRAHKHTNTHANTHTHTNTQTNTLTPWCPHAHT